MTCPASKDTMTVKAFNSCQWSGVHNPFGQRS